VREVHRKGHNPQRLAIASVTSLGGWKEEVLLLQGVRASPAVVAQNVSGSTRGRHLKCRDDRGIAGYVESELLKVSLDDYSEADARIERTKGAISPCRYSKLQLLFSMPELRPHESMSPAGLLGPFDPWPGL
jgi:hypothetical protein